MDDLLENLDADLNHFNEIYPCLRDTFSSQYYDTEKFNSELCRSSEDDFSIIYVNVRSLRMNGDALEGYLSVLKRKFDIICLCETWINEAEVTDDIFL